MTKNPKALLRPFIATCILLTLALLPASLRGNEQPDSASTLATRTIVSKNDEKGLVFDLYTPRAIADKSGNVTVAGLDVSVNDPGAPALPYFTTYIALPPGASYSVEIEDTETKRTPSDFVQPAAAHSMKSVPDSSGLITADVAASLYEPAPSFSPDPLIYENDNYYPEQEFSVSDELYANDLRLVKLDLYPLRYNAVRDIMEQSTRMTVRVQFEGAQLLDEVSHQDNVKNDLLWGDFVLNYPPTSWRVQRPEQDTAVALNLPVGQNTFKIEVDHDGLYAVTGSELAALGLNLATVDPYKMQLMHRGRAVSYQFVNKDGTSGLDATDEIRFYGWKFDGSRYEDMYISNNVFWLWAGGNGKTVKSVANEAGKGYTKVSAFNESITLWPHLNFFPGLDIDWEASPNDATAWHWKRIVAKPGKTGRKFLPIDLHDPVSNTTQKATFLVELTSRYSSLYDSPSSQTAEMYLNKSNVKTSTTWKNGENLNSEHIVPVSQILQPGQSGYPENKLWVEVASASQDRNVAVYTTRMTVEYPRKLNAVADELIFGRENSGKSEFHVSGFSQGSANTVVVWDISDKYTPVRVNMQANQNLPNSVSESVVIGRAHSADARFIATTTENLQKVKSIAKYVPERLTPPNKAGTWVAISHKSLLPAAADLAQYRANRSGLSTWVVDIEKIVNQVGFGFNTPDAIRAYLKIALSDWSEKPEYLIMFGDATANPRLLDCEEGCGSGDNAWDPNKPTLVPTDLLFIDRFNGLIPVDYTFSLLDGDDLLPELAVGRVPAETLAEAQAAVLKIKTYEKSFESPQPWNNNVVFVADNPDSGGSFCVESYASAEHVPDSVNKSFLCLPEDVVPGEPEHDAETEKLRGQLFDKINQNNDVGMAILNYRGHGGVKGWAGYPHIMHVDYAAGWENVGRPNVVLSADCLDGNFASNPYEALGETIFELGNNRGSAAHWSSSGLGYTFEHSILLNSFYDATFIEDLDKIGDAINYAKIVYLTQDFDISEAYAFALLGDPAMETFQLRSTVNLPVVVRP